MEVRGLGYDAFSDSNAVGGYVGATLTIRGLPEDVRERLRVQAARAGRSMEAQVRAILVEASLTEERKMSTEALQQWVDELYGDAKPQGVAQTLIEERRREAAQE